MTRTARSTWYQRGMHDCTIESAAQRRTLRREAYLEKDRPRLDGFETPAQTLAEALYDRALAPILTIHDHLVEQGRPWPDATGLDDDALSQHVDELIVHLAEIDVIVLRHAAIDDRETARRLRTIGSIPRRVVFPGKQPRMTIDLEILAPT